MSSILKGLQLNELSNKKLGDYKIAAGADATAADKAGDYKRGDKRMSGIIKATKKEFDNDAKKLKEFAPIGGDDREPDEEEILRQLAAKWWLGTEQEMSKAQKTLAAMGWDIGQDESGDDDAGVFVIRPGDENGDTYIAFNHSELEELNEAFNNYHANRTGFSSGQRDDERHDLDTPTQVWGLKINGKVWSKGGKDVTFKTKEAALNIRNSILKNRPDLEIGLVTKGGVSEEPMNEGVPSDNDMGVVPDVRSGTSTKMTLGQWKQMWLKKMPHANQGMFRYPPAMNGSFIAYFDGWENTPGARWDPQQGVAEEWSQKYKSSINCSHPKGFSQKAHCAGKKKHNESIGNVMEMTCPDCGMCETHGDNSKDKLDELKCWSGYHRVAGTKAGFPGSCAKNKTNEEQHSESCPHCGGEMVSEELMNEKKDACYYKVKSRYKVWPSAYASGALVKCRNKGAKNWGNGGKKNESSILEGINRADESLHDWFNKEKWVRMDTKGNIKGPCAREPGEGKPKCLPQSKAHSLGKKGRASAAQRKRREDPNPERSGKAINVNTKKQSNENIDEDWKKKLGAAALAGSMALGAAGASADTRRDPFKGLARAERADRQAQTITVGGKEYRMVEISPTDIRPRSGKQIVVSQGVLGERGIGTYMGILTGNTVFVISK